MVGSKSTPSIIYLLGMPGSGKTTLGRQTAMKLGKYFVDLDEYIETKAGKSISDIFEQEGENFFRVQEQKAVLQSAKWKNTVVATGGGAPCFFDNISVLNQNGAAIFIDVSAQELLRRILGKGQDKRPLFAEIQENKLFEEINSKRNNRLPFYTQALYTVSGDKISFEDLLQCIDEMK